MYSGSQFRLTTNYVLAEYIALAAVRRMPRTLAVDFSEEILSDPSIEIVWIDFELHNRAVELIKNRRDKGYSICDAVSFCIMRDREITKSLTTDRHFEQEGFIRLLKKP